MAAGSSEASKTASAKIESAPIGVLSSCEILATKSRRIELRRANSESSKTRIAMRPSAPTGVTRTKRSCVPLPSGPRGSSRVASSYFPDLRTARSKFRIGCEPMRISRKMPSERIPCEFSSTASDAERMMYSASITLSRSMTPGEISGCAGASSILRRGVNMCL